MARQGRRSPRRLLVAATIGSSLGLAGLGAATLSSGAQEQPGGAVEAAATDPGAVQAAVDNGSVFVPLVPVRILDTRLGVGADGLPVGPDASIDVQVAGLGGVPAEATAVVMNVTVTANDDASFLTVWPTGEERPLASNLNWVMGRTIPNSVTVKLGVGGMVSIYNNQGSTHVVADLAGYYAIGPTGPAGPTGPRGPAGVTDYRRANDRLRLPAGGGVSNLAVSCSGGRSVIGGGAAIVPTGSDGPSVYTPWARLVASYPSGTGEWTASVSHEDGSGLDLTVHVICARVS